MQEEQKRKEDMGQEFMLEMNKKAKRRENEMNKKHVKEFKSCKSPEDIAFLEAMKSKPLPVFIEKPLPEPISVDEYKDN